MHKKFEDLIPFYVAQTLPDDERRAVETYLAQSKEAQQEVADWHAIASVVYEDAARHAVGLPPLSPKVLDAIRQSQGRYSSEPTLETLQVVVPPARPTVNRWMSLTMAAAVLMVVLFAGLLASMAARGSIDLTGSDGGGTSIVMLTEESSSQTPLSTLSPTVTPLVTRDMGIVTLTPQTSTRIPDTAVPPAVIQPTTVPQDDGSRGSEEATASESRQAEMAALGAFLPGECTLMSRTGADVPIHRFPSQSSEVIGFITSGQTLRTWVYSGDGWYETGIFDASTIVGWVSAALVQVSGDCANLPLPSPTATQTTTGVGVCAVEPVPTVLNMYAGPGSGYAILNAISPGAQPDILAVSDNGWLRVAWMIGDNRWIGWIPSTSVTLTGNCDTLPGVGAAGYPPEAMPVWSTPTPAITPESTDTTTAE